jgi:hypothetical protein
MRVVLRGLTRFIDLAKLCFYQEGNVYTQKTPIWKALFGIKPGHSYDYEETSDWRYPLRLGN